MPTGSENYYIQSARALEAFRAHILETRIPVVTAIQGFPTGELVVQFGYNKQSHSRMTSSYMRNLGKQHPSKHPNRPNKITKISMNRSCFSHLKKGRIYKFSVKPQYRYGFRFLGIGLFKTSFAMEENRIGLVQSGQMAIYLESCKGSQLLHKIMVDDQIGYVVHNTDVFTLKRVTSRMLRRMENNSESTPVAQER